MTIRNNTGTYQKYSCWHHGIGHRDKRGGIEVRVGRNRRRHLQATLTCI
jgi:hypothetical protein